MGGAKNRSGGAADTSRPSKSLRDEYWTGLCQAGYLSKVVQVCDKLSMSGIWPLHRSDDQRISRLISARPFLEVHQRDTAYRIQRVRWRRLNAGSKRVERAR